MDKNEFKLQRDRTKISDYVILEDLDYWGPTYENMERVIPVPDALIHDVKIKALQGRFEIDLAEHDKQIRAEAIDEYRQCLLKDLIPLKNQYFNIARGTAMPERYTHLKRMDTVDMIIETVNLKAEELKEVY